MSYNDSIDAMMRPSLRQMTADHLISILRAAARITPEQSAGTVLVTDRYTLAILTATLSMSDILKSGFMVIDKFESKAEAARNLGRRPYYPLDVLYYARGNEWNLRRILSDYEDTRTQEKKDIFERCFPWLFRSLQMPPIDPMYGPCRILTVTGQQRGPTPNWSRAHAFLETAARENPQYARVMDYLQDDSPIKDCIIEYMAFDTNCFSLEMHDTLSLLYAHRMANAPKEDDWNRIHKYLELVAFRIATALIVMNERPYIRYTDKTAGSGEFTRARQYSKTVATFLDAHLNAYQNAHPEWTPTGHSKKPSRESDDSHPATIFIVDRMDDLAPVLLHDLTYQSAIADFLDYDPGTPFTLNVASTNGETTSQELLLNDQDRVFQSIRYNEFDGAAAAVRSAVVKLREEGERRKQTLNKRSDAVLKSIIAANKALDDKLSHHVDICLQLKQIINSWKLDDLVILEQEMVTGINMHGKPVKMSSILSQVEAILNREILSSEHQTRLYMLYLLCHENVTTQMRDRLKTQANISSIHQEAIFNMPDFDIPLVRNNRDVIQWSAPTMDQAQAKLDAEAAVQREEFMRYRPKVADFVSAHIDGKLSESTHPFVVPPPLEHEPGKWKHHMHKKGGKLGQKEHSRRESVRYSQTGKFNFGGQSKRTKHSRFADKMQQASGVTGQTATATATDTNTNTDETDDILPPRKREVSGPRVIVFVLGGLTQMESAALEKLSQKQRVEIFYGGTSLITSRDFLDQAAKTSGETVV